MKKMVKKAAGFLLAAALVLSLAACGQSDAQNAAEQENGTQAVD